MNTQSTRRIASNDGLPAIFETVLFDSEGFPFMAVRQSEGIVTWEEAKRNAEAIAQTLS